MKCHLGLSIAFFLAIAVFMGADGPIASGPKFGSRPGPYMFWITTGPNRGQETCFICETAERPAVVVFARNPNDAVARLAGQLDKALSEYKSADLRSWITFIGKDHETFDRPLLEWSKQHALKSLTVGSLLENDGPPTYRVSSDADVTVVLFVKRRVQASFAFRDQELTDEAVKRVMDATAALVEKRS